MGDDEAEHDQAHLAVNFEGGPSIPNGVVNAVGCWLPFRGPVTPIDGCSDAAMRTRADKMSARLRGNHLYAGAAAGVVAVALWWRKHPSACPYGQRFWLDLPRPFITRERLLASLRPAAGERILELGPGTGHYSLTVARTVLPGGRLDLFDLQQEMLDHTIHRAEEEGLENLVPTQGDARDLPYGDDTFDAAYLVTVLGEVPDQVAALRELHRVLKPGGRLVVGEVFGDPHWVSPRALSAAATSAGLAPTDRQGTWLSYYGAFEKP